MLHVFQITLYLNFLRQGLSVTDCLDWLSVSSRDLLACFPSPRVIDTPARPRFLDGCWGSEHRSSCCVSGTSFN